MKDLKEALRSLFAFDTTSEVLRSGAWKGLIQADFDEFPHYDRENPGSIPPGLEVGAEAHVKELRKLLGRGQG